MRIDVIKLQGRWMNAQSIASIRHCVNHAREAGHDVHYPEDIFAASLIQRARNVSLKHVRKDSDFVLFVDDDMVPMQSALTRLVGHNLPAVSALCTNRKFPIELAAKVYDVQTDSFQNVSVFKDNVLCPGPWAPGLGFFLIQTSALQAMIEYVLCGNDWLDINHQQLNRLKVRSENREAERQKIEEKRRALFASDGVAPVFQCSLHDASQADLGEDTHFARLLHLMGTPVYMDTGCLVGHMGDFPFSPVHLGALTNLEVEL